MKFQQELRTFLILSLMVWFSLAVTCPDGQFDNAGTCTNCIARCKTCLSDTTCEECFSNSQLQVDKTCLACTTGWWSDGTTMACAECT